jgi:hypothetical protein
MISYPVHLLSGYPYPQAFTADEKIGGFQLRSVGDVYFEARSYSGALPNDFNTVNVQRQFKSSDFMCPKVQQFNC